MIRVMKIVANRKKMTTSNLVKMEKKGMGKDGGAA